MGRKYLLRELKHLAISGMAINVTSFGVMEYQTLKEIESGFERIGFSVGTYGLTGLLLKGINSGEYYVITSRSAALFIFA